jgi:hypothetical protein
MEDCTNRTRVARHEVKRYKMEIKEELPHYMN